MTPGTSYTPPPAFGRFRLLHQIGAGVLGPVFRTHDEQEQRLAAVKAFTLDITPERAEELSNHLQQVVDIDLEHPHIARPIATGVVDSVAYLAQQYVAGESLDAAIRQYGPAPVNDAARLIGHVAEALDVAAVVGVFHGALHPRDILVTPGETHVTGLGISMALERIGQHGPIRRPYAAPERDAGQEWGAPADVFSLAVIAYEVLTGRRALPGTEQPLPGLADLQVRDAAALREILEAAIDAEPGRRPAKATDFARAMAAALIEAGATHTPGDRGAGTRRKIKPRPPKLPGLDDPVVAQDVAPQDVAPQEVASQEVARSVVPVPAVGATSETTDDQPSPEASRDLATLDEPSAADAGEGLALPTVAVEIVAPIIASDHRHEPVVDWDAAEAESDQLADLGVLSAASRAEPELVIFHEPEAAAGTSTAAREDDDELHLQFASETVATESTRARFDGPDSFVESAEDAERIGLDLPVPRALDPTRDADNFRRPASRYEPVLHDRRDRSYTAPVAMGVAIGLLAGLLGGYEIGVRWGRSEPIATPTASTAASVPTQSSTPLAASTAPRDPVPVPPAAVPTAPAAVPAAPAPAAPPVPRSTDPGVRPEAPGAPATAAPAKPAPAVTEGRISVRTVPPRAEITVDGESAGMSPRVLRNLPFGAHVVRVTLSGYVAQERKVTMTAARPVLRIDITLRKAVAAKPPASGTARETKPGAEQGSTIAFTTRPAGARVILDGKDVGLTPFTMSRVEPGRHKIEIRLSGYRPWSTSITVTAGKPQRVAASLERDISR